MQNEIQILSDTNLLQKTQELVKLERETTTEILHLLREIDRRKLFSSHRCSSLFDFCTRILGYAESSAQRRIASMRLLRELPEIESKIKNGALTLSVISQAQTFFRAEAKFSQGLSRDAKREVLIALQGKSKREAERELLRRSSQPTVHHQENLRAVNDTHLELKVILPNETAADLEKLKGLLAHAHPNLNTVAMLNVFVGRQVEVIEQSPRLAFAQEATRQPSTTNRGDRNEGKKDQLSREESLRGNRCSQKNLRRNRTLRGTDREKGHAPGKSAGIGRLPASVS